MAQTLGGAPTEETDKRRGEGEMEGEAEGRGRGRADTDGPDTRGAPTEGAGWVRGRGEG